MKKNFENAAAPSRVTKTINRKEAIAKISKIMADLCETKMEHSSRGLNHEEVDLILDTLVNTMNKIGEDIIIYDNIKIC